MTSETNEVTHLRLGLVAEKEKSGACAWQSPLGWELPTCSIFVLIW